jgi:UDP-perosamine 4-acetyltransferase
MKLPVIVLGAGGHGRVLLEALRLSREKVIGVTDAQPSHVDKKKLRVPVLGNDKAVLSYSPKKVFLANGLGSTGVTPKRAELFRKFKAKGYRFINVIHPSAVISKDVVLGEGTQVMAGAVIQTGAMVGENTIINTRASIDHDCEIGSHVHIAPGVVLSGGVKVGDGSHLGTGAVIVQNVVLPESSFVKAASLVTQKHLSSKRRRNS